MFVQHMEEHDDGSDTPRRCRRRRLAVTIGHRDGVREVHVVTDDAPGRGETDDARFVAAARTDAKRRDRAAVAAVREARRRVERTAEALNVTTRAVLDIFRHLPDGVVACRAAAPMVVVDDLGLAGISAIVSPRAHENAVETMLALCPEMRACDGLGGMRSKSAQSETKTSVLVDGEGRFGIAVTTRIVREEDDASQCRQSSATWRRWGAPRGRWPKARTNRSSMGTLTRRILPSASLTVCQRFSIQVSPNAAERHAPWPCVETGCVADGLLRVALARKDGRENIPSAAVDIRDLKLLSENARTFSYAELFEASVRVAHFIKDVLHAKPGDVVAAMSRNSYEVFVLHHACALVRCVLLNLNTHLVSRELTYILRDSECRFVFARQREHLDVLNEVVPLMETNAVDSIIWMVDDDEDLSESGVAYPSRVKNFNWNSDALAFRSDERDVLTVLNEELSQIKDAHLYYTSGTTGNPKGVCLKHEVVLTHARATLIEMRLNSQDVWLHAAPMFHLVDAFAIYSITEVCGRHVFLPAFETTRLLRVIASERVTVTNLASSMVAIMTHHPLCGAIDLSSLRLASCGGSPLPPTTVHRAIALLGCEFFVSYGMTECCGKISMSILSDEFRKCHSAEEQVDAICTSGRPFCLMSIKVVQPDDGRTVVASDGRTVGEVFIKGPTLFSGYLKNPEATRRSFDEQGYFATGDLAVVQSNGFISVVDRKKDMILSGGENVYCVEVERVIHAHRAVKQASVLGIPNSIMGEVVHAVVTLKNPSDDETPSDITADLMRHCESQLSQFKCPSAIHIVDALPLNASGKVLKRRLREMIASGEAITANESRGAARIEPRDGRVDAPPPKTSPAKVDLKQISLNAKDDHHEAREVFIVGTSHFDETLRRDAVSVVPITRWDICDVNDRIRVKSGGFLCGFGVFLDEATMFDSQMFGLSDMEAVVADPQQRLILKSVSTLPARPNPCASVHIGVSQVEFPRIFVNVREELSPYYATSAHLSVVAGRVCFTFALSGHAESIDTACSSSLVATHRGYETHSQSIVGGVNVTIDVTWSLACHTANMLSADGRCKTLDASADGYVRAEHCAVLLLSCDHACPTRIVKLCGVAVNQDGRSSSLTAPNGPSQTKVITAAYGGATMESVAMHGTGTPLGDPIEVGALQAAMHDTDLSPVQMYAPKSLFGHSEPASGVTGIALNIKSVASSEIAPLVHLRCVNPHLEAIEKTRDIIMPRELTAMGDRTSASASAFAFQGTNAHGLIHRDSSKFFGTAIVKRRRHARESMLWCARHAHGWIKTGCVLYGRIILTASVVHGLPCASLRDHVIHGQSIAPGTALLEIFVESFVNASNSDVHGSSIVIPHAFKLEGGKKDGPSSTVIANVIVRRHDGRIAVISGPLCQPRTHLYGQACKVCARESFSSVRSRLCMTREMPGQIFASIANTTHGSSQRHSTNLNAYTLDAAIHLAESVLQYHTTLQARIPAGLASVSAGKHKRGDDSVQRIVKTNCAFGDDDGYLKRALHDHFTNHVLLHGLDIRSPLRDRGKTPIRRASRSLVYTSSHHAELRSREKIITRGPVLRSAREDDSTRCLASMITPSTVDDSVLALQKHSEVSSALVGALRSAVHEKSTSSSSVVRCFQYNETPPSRVKDGDPWTVPRVDGGSTHVRMLSPAHLRQGEKNDFHPRHKERYDEPSDTLTVYGGTGALGMYSAKNLGSAENSRRVRVTGRSGRTSQRLQVVDSCQIASLRCDGGTKSETAALASATVFGRLLYTSGILADAIWKKLSFRLVTTVCAPKLHCKRDQLDYVRAIACRVFFSSATACVGNSGQTVYGAANAVLDHRAASACSMGVNVLSLQWGAFSGGGMASGVESHLSRIGIGVLTPDVCVKVLRWCVSNRSKKLISSSLCVSNFDWETFSTFHAKTRESKFFSAVIDGQGQTPVIKGKTQVKAVTTNVDARKIVESAMQSILGQVPSGDCPFFDAGMDSLSSVEFVSAVDESLNMRLPATVVFDYPTPSALIGYLESLKNNERARNATKVPSKVEIDKCREYDSAAKFRVELPGEADTKVWLARDRVTHVTHDRWCYDENVRVPRFGGFYVTDWTLFDVSAFDLQMNESVGVDPQQRATLKHAAEVLYSYSNHSARPSCAVYIGAATTDYMSLAIRGRDSNPYLSTGCAFLSVIAGRISYMLNLSGTALVIDTACSSSLSALHVAHNSSEELRCVGGVNAMLAYQTTAMFATAGMLALDGRCKTLDASADGYARAECCALTLLQRCKTDSEVERVFLDGTAVNQDGRSSSLTAPNGPSQTLVILASTGYSDSLSNTHNLHGTGTALGDPIEVNATLGALKADSEADSIPIILDASKSLCAHSESPSGLIGLASAFTTLSQGFSVGIMHMRELNAHVCASLSTNSLGTLRTPAAVPVALKSGVSAFAFQGTNAHCVVSSKAAQQTHDFINGMTLFDSVRCWQVSPSSKALVLSTMESDRVRFYVRPTITTFDHRVNGQSLLPGAAYLELVSLCGRSLGNGAHISVIKAVFVSPFNLKKSASCVIHRGRATFKIDGVHQVYLAKASMSGALRRERARLATFEQCVSRHQGVYVDGNVDETAREDDGKAMQIDSSFHFVSATWDSRKSLGIPVSVKYFALNSGHVSGGAARVNRSHSDHFSQCADVFGLETHTLSRSEIPTKSTCKAYIAKQLFSPKSRQRSGFKWQGMNAKPLLSALSISPSSCVALGCSESTMNFGIFAALRSVALETSLPCRVLSRNCRESILVTHSNRQIETSRRSLRVLADARYGKEIYISGGSGGLGRCITKNFVPRRFSAARWTCRRGRGRIIFSGIDGTLTLNTPDSLNPTPPCAVIHASGSLADTLWSNLTIRSVTSTFASKCAGTSFAYIDRETHPIGISNTFSSIASLLGSLGQAAYAGSNEVLDARCRVEFHRGRNASSTQWGPWAGSGMGDKDVVRSRLKQIGIEYLSTRDAIGLLITQLSSSVAVLCAASIDWTTHALATDRANDPMFRALIDVTGHRASEKARKVEPSSRKTCSKEILSRVLTCVEQSLGCKIHENDPFMDSGIDSMISIELTNILSQDFSLKLPSTFLFDYPTAAAVAKYVHGTTEVPKTELVRLEEETPEHTVYVDVHFTSHPSSQRWDSVARIPFLKWRVDELRRDRLATSFMTALLDSDMFDISLFSMTKEEACRCDCQQRLLLHASLVTRVAGNTRCGVYIGIASHDHSYLLGSDDQSVFDAVGSFSSVASGRISYVFNYRGPACSIDTACSSSLLAMHQMRMEMSREMEKALAGGINIITHPRVTEQFNRAGMLSPSGRCQTLDQAADGYVRAEACVLVHFGLARNDATVCALSASAANQDGRSSALTAPNGPAQRQVIDFCGYNIKVGHCFHLHGTGTPLGDPIEVNAITSVLQQINSVTSHVEASKSWIGHAEPASGIASVCYSLKQFAQCQEFGYCRLSRLNAHLETIFGFLHANRTRAPGKCTSVGNSSFAFQGSNVHVVIDDPNRTNLVSSAPQVIDARRYACGPRLFESIRGAHVTVDVRVVFSGNTMRSPCISDHRVSGRALFPGAAMMHISTSAASIFSGDRIICSEFLISSALEIASRGTEYHLHLQLTRGACSFTEGDCRRRYFTALVQPAILTVTENAQTLACTRERMRASHQVPVNTEFAYARMCERGLEYGRRFRILQGIRASDHSSRIAFTGHARDELDHIAATDGIMQLAAPFGTEPLAVPIGADLFFTSFKRFESAYAWTKIADGAPTTHRLSNPSTLMAFILHLRVKSLSSRGMTSPVANLYASERCSLPEVSLVKYYGGQVFIFSRAAIDALQCAQMMPNRCRVAGVQTDHLSGLARTFASETQKEVEEFTWRHHETSVFVERLAIARAPKDAPRTRGELLQSKRQTKTITRIIGGFGALGTIVATSELQRPEVGMVILDGRTGRGRATSRALIKTCGVLKTMKRDVSCRSDVNGTDACREILSSGALLDGLLKRHTPHTIRFVHAPKSNAASGTRARSVLLFSSISALLGSSGQANYASANSSLDFIARARRRIGVDNCSIQFGPWSESGMATRHAQTLQRLESMGIFGLGPDQSMYLLHAAIEKAVICLAAFNVRRLATTQSHLSELFSDWIKEDRKKGVAIVNVRTENHDTVSRDSIHNELSSMVAKLLGSAVDPLSPLMQSGLDSLSAMELTSSVSKAFRIDLPSTFFFDHPNISVACDEIMCMRGGGGDSEAIPTAVHIVDHREEKTKHLVASAGCASSIVTNDAVQPIPIEREPHKYSNAANMFAACVPHRSVVSFDSATMGNASSTEFLTLDPRQRILISITVCCLSNLRMPSTGVFIGASGKDYSRFLQNCGVVYNPFTSTGNETSVIAGRLSYIFDLKGPALIIDTACSSSLCAATVALETDTVGALIGGASLILTNDMHLSLGRAGMLSQSGRCRTFDQEADGYGRGEAVEVMYASSEVMSASAISLTGGAMNQDGRSSSLTAPNGKCQQDVINRAIIRSTREDILREVILHAHGTGTALGDPIEMNAALAMYTGSVAAQALKSWWGHTEPASGALALVSAQVQLGQTRQLLGVCHLRRLSNHLSSITAAIKPIVPRQSQILSTSCADVGISAFAFQGTNAHVTLSSLKTLYSFTGKRMTSDRRLHWPLEVPGIVSVRFDDAAINLTVDGSVGHCFCRVVSSLEAVLGREKRFALTQFIGKQTKSSKAIKIKIKNDVVAACCVQGRLTKASDGRLNKSRPVFLRRKTHMTRLLRGTSMESIFFEDITCDVFLLMHTSSAVACAESPRGARCVADDGAVVFMAVGMRRLHSRLYKPQVCYTVEETSVRDVVRNDVRSVSGALILAHQRARARVQDRGRLAIDVVFRNAQHEMGVKSKRPSITPVHLGSSARVDQGVKTLCIFGGTGALGKSVAEKIQSPVSHMYGRTGKCARAPRLLARRYFEIKRVDASVRSETSDETLRTRPDDAILHTGGVLADASLEKQCQESLRVVFAPKLNAVVNCVRASTQSNAHVIFSSIAALLAPPGQLNYSCANACLDEYAGAIATRGAEVISVRWGAFEGVGMASQSALTSKRIARLGVKMLPLDVGISVLVKILSGDARLLATPLVVSEFETTKTTQRFETHADHNDAARTKSHSRASVVDIIHAAVSELLGSSIARDAPLMESGLDSVTSVELKNITARSFNLDLPTTVIFDHPTVDELARYCQSRLCGDADATRTIENHIDDASPTPVRALHCLARSGRFFTGDSERALLENTTRSTGSVPLDRWDVEIADGVGVRFVAFMENVSAFDNVVFGVSASEAIAMDPQHRGILEEALTVVSNHAAREIDTAVAIGIQHLEYGGGALFGDFIQPGPFAATGSALSVCAGRVSYAFGFIKPSICVDTACSSSLTTIHLMLNEGGSSNEYMCGGVNYILGKKNCDAVRVAGMLAPDGRCKVFDTTADGYGRSEAVSMFRFGRMNSDAPVAFVVCGSACGQDGRSASLTAPSGTRQHAVIRAARDATRGQCECPVRTVSLHGTGTALGDPIECSALMDAMDGTPLRAMTLLASKSSGSHAEAAAGSLAVTHAAAHLALYKSPVFLGLSTLNPNVCVSNACVPRQLTATPMERRSDAVGCSAFAFMGTNAHVVVRRDGEDAHRRPARDTGTLTFEKTTFWPTTTTSLALKTWVRVTHRAVVIFQVKHLSRGAPLRCRTAARLMSACASASSSSKHGAACIQCARVVVADGGASISDACTVRVRVDCGRVSIRESRARCAIHRETDASDTKRRHREWYSRVIQTPRVVMARHGRLCCSSSTIDDLDLLYVVGATPRRSLALCRVGDLDRRASVARTMVLRYDSATLCASVSDDARDDYTIYGQSTPTTSDVSYRQTHGDAVITKKSSAPARPSIVDVSQTVFDTLRDLFGEDFHGDENLSAKGLDSIAAVELATTLRRGLGLDEDIDVATLATCATPGKIVEFLTAEIKHRRCDDDPSSGEKDDDDDDPGTTMSSSSMIKCLRSRTDDTTADVVNLPSLFLGAPAFGDGPLAYMKLVDALTLGAHATHTLERDTTAQPWPEAAESHAREIMRRQPSGGVSIGGHSLGGVLAIETALSIERAGRRVDACLLFDAPHPVQFKSEWNDVPSAEHESGDGTVESTGLKYMEVALQSFHFDTASAGWSTLSRDEKYDVFESVVRQATGRDVHARELDEQISAGPYAAQWNAAMPRMDDGSVDSSAWWMLRGTEAKAKDTNDDTHPARFTRLKARVSHYKAGIENAALFETDLRLDADGSTLRSVGGYVWPLVCDDVEIVACRGSHMNLMTDEEDGGDLRYTVVPHARCALAKTWKDLSDASAVESSLKGSSHWRRRVWDRALGLWMRASPSLAKDMDRDDEEGQSSSSSSSSSAALRFANALETFDRAAFGLNPSAWDRGDAPVVWVVGDLIADVEAWSKASFASALPIRAVHVPRCVSRRAAGDVADVAARCVGVILRLDKDGGADDDGVTRVPIIIAALHHGDVMSEIAFETAMQLKRRGASAVSVVVVADKGADAEDEPALRRPRRHRRSPDDRPCFQAYAMKLAETEAPRGWRELPLALARNLHHRTNQNQNQNQNRSRASRRSTFARLARDILADNRPPSIRPSTWTAEIDAEVRACDALVQLARGAFHPGVISAHVDAFDAQLRNEL